MTTPNSEIQQSGMIEPQILDLAAQLDHAPHSRSAVVIELGQTVKDYFHERLLLSGSDITPDILAVADQLYELPVVPSMAEALRITVHELRHLLGIKSIVSCYECEENVEIIRPRIKGGYASAPSTLCADCKAERARDREEKSEAARFERLQAIAEEQMLADVDRLIGELPLIQALGLPDVTTRLRKYHRIWGDSSEKMFVSAGYHFGNYKFVFGSGCMICDDKPYEMLIMRDEYLPNQPVRSCTNDLFAYWKATYREYERRFYESRYCDPKPTWAPTTKTLQLLWRVYPESYFALAGNWPLVQRPLLFVCPQHAGLFEETHIHVCYDRQMYHLLK
jgi:hypothetical protein